MHAKSLQSYLTLYDPTGFIWLEFFYSVLIPKEYKIHNIHTYNFKLNHTNVYILANILMSYLLQDIYILKRLLVYLFF